MTLNQLPAMATLHKNRKQASLTKFRFHNLLTKQYLRVLRGSVLIPSMYGEVSVVVFPEQDQ